MTTHYAPRSARERAYLAATIATAFAPMPGLAPDAAAVVALVKPAARRTVALLGARMPDALCDRLLRTAEAMRARARTLIDGAHERTAVMVCVVSALLDSAPDVTVDLDRAVLDAVRAIDSDPRTVQPVTAHATIAQRIIDQVAPQGVSLVGVTLGGAP